MNNFPDLLESGIEGSSMRIKTRKSEIDFSADGNTEFRQIPDNLQPCTIRKEIFVMVKMMEELCLWKMFL